MTLKIARIAVPSPLQRCFDYLIPAAIATDSLCPGIRVSVPFGKRKLIGVLIEVVDHSHFATEKLRAIDTILDQEPLFDEKLLNLLCWASQYYQYPIGEVLQQAMPILLRQGHSAIPEPNFVWQANSAAATAVLKRAPKQKTLLELLLQHPDGLNEAQLRDHGFKSALWLQLAAKNYIHRVIVNDTVVKLPTTNSSLHTLNNEQQTAVNAVCEKFNSFQTFLLKGVTGSGKTEVYLTILEKILAESKQALILVPEISLTPQMVARFTKRFNVGVGVLHSNLTETERLNTWIKAKNGDIALIIGTRSSIFTAFKTLGIIIIDEEHDASFKQQDNFRYSARDLAIRRAQIENIPIVLGSATPSLETLHNTKTRRYQLLNLPQRAGDAKNVKFQLVDLRRQVLQAGLAPVVIEAIRDHLQRGNQVLLFLNRRGFASALFCHDCGWSAKCKRCEMPMTLHQHTQKLHCHHCDARTAIFKNCPECQSKQLLNLGIGTERLELELQKLFSEQKIIRIDRDTTRRKGSMEAKLTAIHEGVGQILIGTQMLAKGHHFPNVTLVVILNADQGLLSTDFRATERVGQLLIQVAGRAGRADKPGTVMIQTHQPENSLLQTLVTHDYDEFANKILTERESANFPPFSFTTLIRAESVNVNATENFLTTVRQICQNLLPEKNSTLELLGPIPALMPKKAGKYRAQLLLRSQQRSDLQKLLQPLRQELELMKEARGVRWAIDVDPIE